MGLLYNVVNNYTGRGKEMLMTIYNDMISYFDLQNTWKKRKVDTPVVGFCTTLVDCAIYFNF